MGQQGTDQARPTVFLEQESTAAPTSAPAEEGGPSLLDSLIVAAATERAAVPGQLDHFLAEASFKEAVALWVGGGFDFSAGGLKDRLRQKLGRDMAYIDDQ